MTVDPKMFEELVNEAIDSLPEQTSHTKNLVITTDYDPSPEQRAKLKLMPGHSLFGLYEGVPLTQRGNNYSMVLPDKITIFQGPMEQASQNMQQLKANIKRTVWHEIAHHYGLNHSDMDDRINQKP